MSTIYMSQLSTALPLMEVPGDHHHLHHHQDHHQGHFQAFSMQHQHPKDPPLGVFPFVIAATSSSSDVNGGPLSYGSGHQPQHMMGGSSGSVFAAPFPTVDRIRDDMIERSSSSFDPYDINNGAGGDESAANAAAAAVGDKYWSMHAGSAPAKMRITRKASDPAAPAKKPRRRAQAYEDNYSYSSSGMNQALGVIRVCSHCNTTKTPLWRSGPCGPKSLCNACGIRQRKARRAAMAMAMASGGPVPGSVVVDAAAAAVHVQPPKVKKEKIRSAAVDVDRSLPFKKRSKLVQHDHTAAPVTVITAAAAAPARDLAESMGAKWTKKSPAPLPSASHMSSSVAAASCFRRPSPPPAVQDEITDAALLLMTLSCELVRS